MATLGTALGLSQAEVGLENFRQDDASFDFTTFSEFVCDNVLKEAQKETNNLMTVR